LKELFDIERGKSIYTKKFGNANKGEYPVYSASNNAPLTSINTYDHDGQYLTWATNGFAGYIMLIEGKFSINADRGLLKPKKRNIDLLYIKNIIEPKLREMAKGRKGEKGADEFTKVYPSMIEDIEIIMPIDMNNDFDVETQKNIVEKILTIEDVQKKVQEYKEQIKALIIDIDIDNSYFKEFELTTIFDFPPIKGLTKDFINKNKGEIPVYGGKIQEEPIGYVLDNLSNVKYFNNCLAWNREGSVGYVFWHKHKFTTNDHHRPILIKEEFKDLLDLDYLRKTLEDLLMNQGFSWSKTASKEKIQQFAIKIPVNSEGIPDIILQKQISVKQHKIELIKQNITDELDKISNIEINFE